MDEATYGEHRRVALAHLASAERLYVVEGYAGWEVESRIKACARARERETERERERDLRRRRRRRCRRPWLAPLAAPQPGGPPTPAPAPPAAPQVRVVCSRPYHALFMRNMLIRPPPEELAAFGASPADLTILNAGEAAAPSKSGARAAALPLPPRFPLELLPPRLGARLGPGPAAAADEDVSRTSARRPSIPRTAQAPPSTSASTAARSCCWARSTRARALSIARGRPSPALRLDRSPPRSAPRSLARSLARSLTAAAPSVRLHLPYDARARPPGTQAR